MLKTLFGLKRLLVELRRIANALEVIALHFAKLDGRMWAPGRKLRIDTSKEESELLGTRDEDMLVRELREYEDFTGGGYGEER